MKTDVLASTALFIPVLAKFRQVSKVAACFYFIRSEWKWSHLYFQFWFWAVGEIKRDVEDISDDRRRTGNVNVGGSAPGRRERQETQWGFSVTLDGKEPTEKAHCFAFVAYYFSDTHTRSSRQNMQTVCCAGTFTAVCIHVLCSVWNTQQPTGRPVCGNRPHE